MLRIVGWINLLLRVKLRCSGRRSEMLCCMQWVLRCVVLKRFDQAVFLLVGCTVLLRVWCANVLQWCCATLFWRLWRCDEFEDGASAGEVWFCCWFVVEVEWVVWSVEAVVMCDELCCTASGQLTSHVFCENMLEVKGYVRVQLLGCRLPIAYCRSAVGLCGFAWCPAAFAHSFPVKSLRWLILLIK